MQILPLQLTLLVLVVIIGDTTLIIEAQNEGLAKNITLTSPANVSTDQVLSQDQHQHQHQNETSIKSSSLWEMLATMDIERENGNLLASDARRTVGPYDFSILLDDNGRYRIDWTFDYPGNEIYFLLNINVTSQDRINSPYQPGSDVFAIGFSERGQLENSDFCLIWYDLAYKLHVQDARVDGDANLELLDQSTNRACRLSSNLADWQEQVRSSSSMRVEFKRPLDNCEWPVGSYYNIDNGTTHLVWFSIRGPVLSLTGLNLRTLQSASGAVRKPPANDAAARLAELGKFNWGMKRVQLLATKSDGYIQRRADRHKTRYHDVHVDGLQIPSDETTYWCKLYKLPEHFDARRYHITKYGPLITIGNKAVVHHMELFNCANLLPKQEQELQSIYESGGWSGNCQSQQRPIATEACKRVIMAWAMGARSFEYPSEVGQSIGGPNYSRFVMLEIHYNNVERVSGLIDHSGLRFEYTSQLRPFDAGILEVGLEYNPKNSIPPGLIAPMAGYCVGECTRLAFSETLQQRQQMDLALSQPINSSPQQQQQQQRTTSSGSSRFLNESLLLGRQGGIFVFGAQMHTHLTGVASWTEQVRGSEIIAELQRDDHYSPHFQEIRLLPERVYVAPGDSLIHYCVYDTRKRNNITLGGFSTRDEMCVTYLHYYPRVQLEVCKSSVDSKALEQYFAYLARDEYQQTSSQLLELRHNPNIDVNVNEQSEHITGANTNTNTNTNENDGNRINKLKSIGQNYNSIEWSPKRSLNLLEFYSNAPLSVQCDRGDGTRFPGYWDGIQQPNLVDYVELASGRASNRANFNAIRRDLLSYRGRESRRRHAQCNGDFALSLSRRRPT